jgi:hypothetical protein
MPHSENFTLTYGQLLDQAKTKILNLVQNRDGYSASVPAEIKSGYSKVYSINRWGGLVNAGYTYKYVFKLLDNPKLGIATTENINREFMNFMRERGIVAKSSNKVTTRGLINFFNNLAAFCSVKLIIIDSQFAPNKVVYYNTQDNNFPAVDNIPVNKEGDEVVAADYNTILTELNTTLNTVSKQYIARYSTSTSSSSSSSSCSSSSSSSSSSSCSSVYIAYFNLN